jgi:hypothetical protein
MRMFQRFLDTMSQNLSPILLNRSETSPFHPPFKIKSPTKPINTDFVRHIPLFKLAESSLIQVILIWLSIPFCIDSLYFFHTLFFVSHIFSTNPVPFSLLCVVPVAYRFVYYSENNHLIVCKSTYRNYNLRTMFLQLEILRY